MISRRRFLIGSGSIAATPLLPHSAAAAASDPFTLGVASGVPRTDSVLLWTRLAPDPLRGGGMLESDAQVRVRVARDEQLRDVLIDQLVVAPAADAHSVHFTVAGLEAGREYWYQFSSNDFESPIGRTKTAPAAGADSFRLAFASCQHWESGLYAAYRDMAENRPDLILHLGDYIYEGAAGQGRLRQHNSAEINTLYDYRNRHALYRSDPHLQQAHASAPWLVSPDDHEIDNNWAGYTPQDPQRQTELEFRVRRWAAMRAYYEHMPIAHRPTLQGLDSKLQIYGSFQFGDLLKVMLLDTRQYRSDQPCGQAFPSDADCADRYSNDTSLTGRDQEAWLRRELRDDNAQWNLMAQQTWFSQFRYPGNQYNMDQWDGYAGQRNAIIEALQRPGLSNPVVLSGDWHCGCAMDVLSDFDNSASSKVAAELAGTSISSNCSWANAVEEALPENPHVRYYSGNRRGYVSCEINRERLVARYHLVADAARADAEVSIDQELQVENGRRGFAS